MQIKSDDFYHGNKKLPVYLCQSSRLETQEIVRILLDLDVDEKMLCSIQPLNVGHNIVFLVDLLKLKSVKDLLWDLGSMYNGNFMKWFHNNS